MVDDEADEHEGEHGREEVEFTIDGEEFKTRKHRELARELLRLAGLDPSLYDLGEVRRHHATPLVFRDDQEVEITRGARFVSIRTGPAPVE